MHADSLATTYQAELTALVEAAELVSIAAQTAITSSYLQQVYHTRSAVVQRAPRKRDNSNAVHILKTRRLWSSESHYTMI